MASFELLYPSGTILYLPMNVGAVMQAREEVVDAICRKEIGVYSQIFSDTGETANLDRTERRHAYLGYLGLSSTCTAVLDSRHSYQLQHRPINDAGRIL